MDLLQNIRTDRIRQGRKQPYGRRAFTTISCIVKAYALDENFLKRDECEDSLDRNGVGSSGVKPKRLLDVPPFSLLPEAEYRLAAAIAGRWDSPYLPFAHSPEEILLSASLYEANPSLTSRDLLRWDFETLLRCERARRELSDLEERSGALDDTLRGGGEEAECGGERSRLSVSGERIRELRAFVATVENRESRTE